MSFSLIHRMFLLLALSVSAALAQTQTLDFGDAPDVPYPTTLKNNGARHGVTPNFCLGTKVDGETDGRQSADATGDDTFPVGASDDEDGVQFISSLIPGEKATIIVTITGEGLLNGWVDFNGNGSWADTGDQIFVDLGMGPGPHTLNFVVPASAKVGRTFARFRLSHQGKISFTGPAPDGEVEDYSVDISGQLMDFGDAPDTSKGGYPTTLARNGARHQILPSFRLGKLEDGELNGQPHPTATGDDTAGGPNDEDGVRFLSSLVPGAVAQVEIVTTAGGRIDAWIDFNRNESWADATDRIFLNRAVTPGVNVLSFPVPIAAQAGISFARFRLSRQGGLSFDGPAPDGEVEDYTVTIQKASRCDLSCTGTDFWLTFPGNYAPDPANPVKPSLWIVGPIGTSVTAAIPGIGFSKTVVIPVGFCVSIDLPKEADLGDANNKIQARGVHVTATALVDVHGLSKVQFTSDGYLGLPTEALGTEYYVLAYRNDQVNVPELNGSQFAIVGTEAGTTVTIVPSTVVGTNNAGDPFTITLGPGDAYQLRTTTGAPIDLTGTHILSDKPVAVFGGHACANIRSGSAAFCDYLVEQLPPITQWATEFYTRRLATRSKGEIIRVLAAHNNTVVSINGAAATTLGAGEYYETLRPSLALVDGTQITATKPVLVAQYATSSDSDGNANSDPFMTLVPGKALWIAAQRFCVPNTPGFLTHHINIISPSVSAGTVALDGFPVGGFTPIAATGFSSLTLAVSPGSHSITASQPIGVNVYGWGKYESYGWPACFFFGDITPPVVDCPPPITVTLSANAATGFKPCFAPVPDFTRETFYSDNCPRQPGSFAVGNQGPTQDPPVGTLVGPGMHLITVSVADARGNVGYCTTTFTVIDPNPSTNALPSIICPQDMVVKCGDGSGAVVDYKVYGLMGCQEVEVVCDPPPHSFFPIGSTTVTCTIPGSVPLVKCSFQVHVSCAQVVVNAVGPAQLNLNWEGGSKLQVAPSLFGPWTDFTTQDVISIGPSNKSGFFRVK